MLVKRLLLVGGSKDMIIYSPSPPQYPLLITCYILFTFSLPVEQMVSFSFFICSPSPPPYPLLITCYILFTFSLPVEQMVSFSLPAVHWYIPLLSTDNLVKINCDLTPPTVFISYVPCCDELLKKKKNRTSLTKILAQRTCVG